MPQKFVIPAIASWLVVLCMLCTQAHADEFPTHICGYAQKFYIDDYTYENNIGIIFKEMDTFNDGISAYDRQLPKGTYKFLLGKEQIGIKNYANLLESIIRNMGKTVCIKLHKTQKVVIGMTIPD